ncbi:MAG: hypothetical protein JSU92_01020 [Deltaproteobacteria bacterium]|nr:MAG: hypothetical protein JSU92_01020 [Deltaproteobacteria bacterium]
MSKKPRNLNSDDSEKKPQVDDFIKPPQDIFSTQEDSSSKPLFEEDSARLLLDDGIPMVSSKNHYIPSDPSGPKKGPFITLRWDKNKKLIKFFLISGGATAILLLTLRAGSYLLNSSASMGQIVIAPVNKAVASPSELSGDTPTGILPVASPPLIPVPGENKSPEPLSPVKKAEGPPPTKIKKRPPAAAKKSNENAEQVYKLYIDKKFILDETRAISLKLSILGIENRIVKRKDGGYTIFAGTYKELTKARETWNKILNAGYQANIYSVAMN